MTFKEIEFALEVNGIEQKDTQTIMEHCKKAGIDYYKLDDMLVGMGYDKVFTDEFFGWIEAEDDEYNEDDDYSYVEKIHHPYNRLED